MLRYLILVGLVLSSLWVNAQDKKVNINLYLGAGYQDLMGPMNYGTAIEYVGFELSMETTRTRGGFFDLGIEFERNRHHWGGGIRFAQSAKFDMDTRTDLFRIDFLPRLWYSYYFGKQDKRGFRADFTFMTDREIEDVKYDPVNPSDIKSSFTYFSFGPQLGTRIIRKGTFANTYLIGGPLFAPPIKYDSYLVENPSWNIRWMVGVSKSISFKKK
jgi:hypothetical protein